MIRKKDLCRPKNPKLILCIERFYNSDFMIAKQANYIKKSIGDEKSITSFPPYKK